MIRLELVIFADGGISSELEVEDWTPAADVEPWIRAWAAANAAALEAVKAMSPFTDPTKEDGAPVT